MIEKGSDDDPGVRMLSAAEMASAAPSSSDPNVRQLKLVNLINWEECNMPEESDNSVLQDSHSMK